VTPVSYNRPGLPATLGKPKEIPRCYRGIYGEYLGDFFCY
jgi:hypothetical protein